MRGLVPSLAYHLKDSHSVIDCTHGSAVRYSEIGWPNILGRSSKWRKIRGASVPYRLAELKIELTQECPLACLHCSTNSSRKQTNSLPKEVVLRLLREGAGLGVKKVVFTGGEPLVAQSLGAAIGTAADLGIAATLYTSGIVDNVLNPMSAELAATLVARGIKRFIFSVYSHLAVVHESVTRYGTHKPTLIAITNAVRTGVPVELHFVAMRRNFRDLHGVIELAKSVGVEKVSVLRFVPQGRGRNISSTDDLTGDELRELAAAIVVLRREYPTVMIRAGSPYNILGIGHTPCNAAKDVLIINHRGEIFPCDAFKNVRYNDSRFGNVLGSSLSDIWEHSLFLNQVRNILSNDKGGTCQSCEQARDCQSGCLAQKVIREGWESAYDPDPSCLVEPPAAIEFGRPVLVQISDSRS